MVDRTALRFNQAMIIGLLTLGFIVDFPWLALFVGIIMGLGTLVPRLALFQRIYTDVLRPLGLLRSDAHAESPAPHRFAQGVGSAVLLVASAAFVVGAYVLGWGLSFVVVVLAAINLLFGFCAGCFLYFQIQRLRT